jgi:putative ATPase
MEDLFADKDCKYTAEEPLAAFMRPKKFEHFVGQRHILAPGKLLRRAIDADRFSSIIFSGPPGTGKTSLSELIATVSNSAFIRLSGISSNVSDIRKEISNAIHRRKISGRHTILFIDEIHRFNKAQQDVLLPDVESGNVRLIGATTHNPNFYIIPPLLSRSLVFILESLSQEDISSLIDKAVETLNDTINDYKIEITEEARKFLSISSEGDARKALNAFDIAEKTTILNKDNKKIIDLEIAEESIQLKSVNYDDSSHYDTISAFIKSMRGSDPDAALYWLAKMLYAGEDIRFIARRIVIFASEDIGNADPRAISLAMNSMQAVEAIGMPEARIILAQATTYCATAPKSNASYVGINTALSDIKQGRIQPVPKHLRDSHYKGAAAMGHGENYKYPHNNDNSYSVQDYIGIRKKYYTPRGTGYELKIQERLRFWEELRHESARNKQ